MNTTSTTKNAVASKPLAKPRKQVIEVYAAKWMNGEVNPREHSFWSFIAHGLTLNGLWPRTEPGRRSVAALMENAHATTLGRIATQHTPFTFSISRDHDKGNSPSISIHSKDGDLRSFERTSRSLLAHGYVCLSVSLTDIAKGGIIARFFTHHNNNQ